LGAVASVDQTRFIAVMSLSINVDIFMIRVDNQRIDYMAAYENHMLDVQKELYLLREKVQEIATDGLVSDACLCMW
jgi:hypothetical protein